VNSLERSVLHKASTNCSEKDVELGSISVDHNAGRHIYWGGEEVEDMIRYLILRLRAKATSFPQFINVNGLRLRKGRSFKNRIPPFHFTINL